MDKITESLKKTAITLFEKLNELAKEGNKRKVIIKSKHGKKIVEFPMTLGIAGVVIAPILASIGLVAFFVAECTMQVEKHEEKETGEKHTEEKNADKKEVDEKKPE